MTVSVPERPVLVTVPSVELIHAGRWAISSGEWNVTSADLYAAVAALDCPAVRRPVLKLGHTDPRFDGEPAVGWIGNLAVDSEGVQLVGDYTGVPAWLGDVLASAYPDRSIEGEYGHRCQLGHTHPFVLTAVALLGVTAPGVGTLESLQDVAALYGVAAADQPASTGDRVRLPVNAKGAPVPQPIVVAATATVEDVRRAFYEGPAADNWWWIEDLFVDPLELVAIDDENGSLWRLTFSVDDDGAVTFGDPQQVRREYVAASATMRQPVATWASSAESRPGKPAAAAPASEPVSLLDGLRQQLGLPADADEATVLAANAEALSECAEPQTVAASTGGPDLHREIARLSSQLAEVSAREARREKQDFFRAAVTQGRIKPAELTELEHMYDGSPEATKAFVLARSIGSAVPVNEIGHAGDADGALATAASVRETPAYKNWSF
jgi:hypothetical protein